MKIQIVFCLCLMFVPITMAVAEQIKIKISNSSSINKANTNETNAFDNNISTFYHSKHENNPWLSAYFGFIYSVERVEIINFHEPGQKYQQ